MELKISRTLTLKDSSIIDSAEYKVDEKELHVRFNNESVYVYYDVDDQTVRNWMKAESLGSYFKEFIANSFEYERMI